MSIRRYLSTGSYLRAAAAHPPKLQLMTAIVTVALATAAGVTGRWVGSVIMLVALAMLLWFLGWMEINRWTLVLRGTDILVLAQGRPVGEVHIQDVHDMRLEPRRSSWYVVLEVPGQTLRSPVIRDPGYPRMFEDFAAQVRAGGL